MTRPYEPELGQWVFGNPTGAYDFDSLDGSQRGGLQMQSRGVELIAAERQRQVDVEGWTSQHDAQHKGGELALAAAVYAVPNHLRGILMVLWPWGPEWYKPKDRIRDLVRAGALIAAEIDRLLSLEGGADGATD